MYLREGVIENVHTLNITRPNLFKSMANLCTIGHNTLQQRPHHNTTPMGLCTPQPSPILVNTIVATPSAATIGIVHIGNRYAVVQGMNSCNLGAMGVRTIIIAPNAIMHNPITNAP
jgi:hypothetical protein